MVKQTTFESNTLANNDSGNKVESTFRPPKLCSFKIITIKHKHKQINCDRQAISFQM